MKFFLQRMVIENWGFILGHTSIFLSHRVDEKKTYSGLFADQNGGCNTPPGKAENNFIKKQFYIS